MIQEQTTEVKKKGKGKIIFALILTLVIAAGAGGGFYFVWQNAGYLTTDNARVTTNLVAISSVSPGILERLMVYEGRYVLENEILGWIQNGEAMRSPVDGIVVHSNAVQGQIVAPLEAVAVVADTNNLHVQANIEETDIMRIQIGQPAIVTIDPLGGREFAGYVSEIGRITAAELAGQAMFFNTGGTFTRVTHLIPVKINIVDDVNLNSFIGVNARVRIPLRITDGDILHARDTEDTQDTDTAMQALRRDVSAAPGAEIESIYAAVGDYVTEGQILARLDTHDLELTIEQQRATINMLRQNSAVVSAQASLRAIEISLADAEHNNNTLRTLYNAGAASQNDLRQSEVALNAIRQSRQGALELLNAARSEVSASLRQAELTLQMLENQLEDAIITAPISGIVTAVFAREGAASPGLLFVIEERLH